MIQAAVNATHVVHVIVSGEIEGEDIHVHVVYVPEYKSYHGPLRDVHVIVHVRGQCSHYLHAHVGATWNLF